MQDKSDICIIGGGVMGLFTALLLARAGKSVCIIDKTYAASSRYNIGEVAPNGTDSTLNPLIKLSQEIWLNTAGAEPDEHLGVTLRGRVELTAYEDILPIFQQEVSAENEASIPTTYFNREQLLDHFHEINPEIKFGHTIYGAKYIPEEPVISTKTCLTKLKAAVIKAGVKIWGSDEVEQFLLDGSKITGVRTTAGDECHAKHTIVTAGVFVGPLMAKLDIGLPIRPARCHIMHITPNDVVPEELIIQRGRFGHIYLKTNRQGRMMLTYDGLADANQATFNIAPNPATTMWLQAEAARMLPALANARVQEQTTVLLSVTPDYLPCIGSFPQYQNLSVAVGMGGRSFALAAGTAHCLTQHFLGKDIPIDLTPFKPTRFAESTWQKSRLPSNLAAISEHTPAPPPTINMVEKHIETMRASNAFAASEEINRASNVNMTGDKNIERNDSATIKQEMSGDVKQAEHINMTGDKHIEGLDKEIIEGKEKVYSVPGQIGFKEDKKKATLGKLGA